MAEYIIGHPLRNLAREHRSLRQLLWRLDFALFWLVVKMAKLLPVDAASRFGYRVGAWIGPRVKRKTAIYRQNMATAFPELDADELDRLVVRAWGNAGRILAEYLHLETILNEPERLIIDIRQPITTYQQHDRPCVMVAAHHSNWEVVCLAMARMGIPNNSLYSPPTNPLLDKMLLDARGALGCDLSPRDQGPRLLTRALKQGKTAAMVMDRRVDGGEPIAFFGRDKPSTTLPARLALKHHCELVPVEVERLRDARYRVTFHPPITPGDTAADETAQAIDMIEQVHRYFETWIRQRPEEWFCSKLIWPKTTNANKREVSGSEAGINRHAA